MSTRKVWSQLRYDPEPPPRKAAEDSRNRHETQLAEWSHERDLQHTWWYSSMFAISCSYFTSIHRWYVQPTSFRMSLSTLPPVRLLQDAPFSLVACSPYASPEQPPSQSSLVALDLGFNFATLNHRLGHILTRCAYWKIPVIAEQEAMKREVCTLCEVTEERWREVHLERAQQEERICQKIEEVQCPPDLHRAEQEQE